MKNIWKNSLIFIIFISFFIFKDSIYNLFDNKELNFNYLKENELNYYKEEYENLLKIHNMNLENNNYILSKIIYRDIYDFYNQMLINKGSNDNIKKGDVVVSENSLVGVISKVNKNSSYVNLLYNKDLKVSVKINDTYGILESINNKLYVTNVVSESNINIGDVIYTSGLTSITGSIPVGIVNNISTTKDKLSMIIEVDEISNLKDINYVVVISKEESDSTS